MDEYFENGYHIDRYNALEEDLLNFLNYITLEFYPKQQNQRYIRSIYLADLMLRMGSNISIFFDKFIECHVISGEISVAGNLFTWQESRETRKEFKDIKKKNQSNSKWQGWNWANYKKLEPIMSLSDQHVLLIPLNEDIYPFKNNGKRNGKSWTEINANEAFWWNDYNKIKHNAAFKDANLNNVLQSLAALFLLISRSDLDKSKKLFRYNYYERGDRGELLSFNVTTRLFSRNIWQDKSL
ncbi:MAG: hypothetical protein ACP5PV_08475 [Methanothrix sp.]